MAQAVSQNFLDSDPEIQAILRKAPQNNTWFPSQNVQDQVNASLAKRGLQVPQGYYVTPQGHLQTNDPFDYSKLALAGAAVGAPVLLGLAGPAAVASTAALGPTTASSIAATTAAEAAPAGIAAGTAGTAATVAGAAAGGTSLWKTLAAPAIGTAGQVVGSVIQAGAQKDATAAQLQAAQEAEAFLKQKYAQTQTQVAPYISSGQGALAALTSGLGIDPQARAIAAAQPTNDPVAGPFIPIPTPGQTVTGKLPPGTVLPQMPQSSSAVSSPGNPSQPLPNSTQSLSQSSVRLQAPTGEVQSVPASQAQYYINQGAKVVS